MMLKLITFLAWGAILFAVNKFLLADEWAEYAFTFVSALLMSFLLIKADKAGT
ncbi:hypothetical protein [Streptomyces wuyuanensis]|uniref:hypothetical protein n=1 Tax=Streptomyces wuyuanensis TaxID=1196353 RepID=UPI003449CE6E